MSSNVNNNVNNVDNNVDQVVHTFTMEQHPFQELMNCQRLDFGDSNLELAFKVYQHVKKSLTQNEVLEDKFIDALEKNGLTDRYFYEMLKDYCHTRDTMGIVVIDNKNNYDYAISEFTNAHDLQRVIKRIDDQRKRLPISVYVLHGKEYEVRGEYLDYMVDDLKLLLNYCH
jgi:hypothetical protein